MEGLYIEVVGCLQTLCLFGQRSKKEVPFQSSSKLSHLVTLSTAYKKRKIRTKKYIRLVSIELRGVEREGR